MEDPRVFERAHRLLFELIDERSRAGAAARPHRRPLRPGRATSRRCSDGSGADPATAPRATRTTRRGRCRSSSRRSSATASGCPASWPVDGTTGYEFAAPRHRPARRRRRGGDPHARAPSLHRRRADRSATTSTRCKRRVVEESLAAEVNVLSRRLERLAASHRAWRDFTLSSLTRALVETLVAFPVYRTYLRAARPAHRGRRARTSRPPSGRARRDHAGRRRRPSSRSSRTCSCSASTAGEPDADVAGGDRPALPAAHRTGDGEVRRGHGLLPLQPAARAQRGRRRTPGASGRASTSSTPRNAERLRTWPLSMITTSTHDSKRGEDAAARIAVLSRDAHRVGAGGDALDAPARSGHRSLVDARAGAVAPRPVHVLPGARRRVAGGLGRRRRAARSSWRAPRATWRRPCARRSSRPRGCGGTSGTRSAVRRYRRGVAARRRLRRRRRRVLRSAWGRTGRPTGSRSRC